MNSDEIKALRTSLGISQEELGRKLGVSIVSIGRWERGEVKPSKLAMEKLTKIVKSEKKK